jgi:rfaE bifunctional protein kinase chain/domain
VPIVNVRKRENRLGGAANVALNIQSLGATPLICSMIGNDDDALIFEKLLQEKQISSEAILQSEHRITTVKHRVLANSQHLLRIDSEIDAPISINETQILIDKVASLLPQVDVIIFEDYDKGVLTAESISAIISLSKKYNIPTVVDPKKRNFLSYQNCTLFKPNLKELKEGLKIEINEINKNTLSLAVKQLAQKMPIEMALITLSEQGVFIQKGNDYDLISAHQREIADVSGAGDTVVSIASLCLALGLNMQQTASLANLGGGLVCEHLGVVPIQKEKLLTEAQRLLKHYF